MAEIENTSKLCRVTSWEIVSKGLKIFKWEARVGESYLSLCVFWWGCSAISANKQRAEFSLVARGMQLLMAGRQKSLRATISISPAFTLPPGQWAPQQPQLPRTTQSHGYPFQSLLHSVTVTQCHPYDPLHVTPFDMGTLLMPTWESWCVLQPPCGYNGGKSGI